MERIIGGLRNLIICSLLYSVLGAGHVQASEPLLLENFETVPSWMLDKMSYYKDQFKTPCVPKAQDCSGRAKIRHDFEYDIGKISMKSYDLDSLLEDSIFRGMIEKTDWFYLEEKKSYNTAFDLMRRASTELIMAENNKKEAIGMGFQLAALLFSNAYGGDYGKDPKKFKKAIDALSVLERAQYLYELSLSNLAEPSRDYYYFYQWILAELHLRHQTPEAKELKKDSIAKLISRYRKLWEEKGYPISEIESDRIFLFLKIELESSTAKGSGT